MPCEGLTSHVGKVAILLGMLHTKETGISSGRLVLWLVCIYHFLPTKSSAMQYSSLSVLVVMCADKQGKFLSCILLLFS